MEYKDVNDRVDKIKHDEKAINELVREYQPYIASCTEAVTGRFVKYGVDDELSIAMLAFVEAIKSYDRNKGSFLNFSRNVIKRRLIDYYRKESRNSGVISLEGHASEDEDTNGTMDLSYKESVSQFSQEELNSYRRLELMELKKELEAWGITLHELVQASPKAEKTRYAYRMVIRYLLASPEAIHGMKTKKYLPVAEIEKNTGIQRKTVERGRKYIIAASLICSGDYSYIKEYINIYG